MSHLTARPVPLSTSGRIRTRGLPRDNRRHCCRECLRSRYSRSCSRNSLPNREKLDRPSGQSHSVRIPVVQPRRQPRCSWLIEYSVKQPLRCLVRLDLLA